MTSQSEIDAVIAATRAVARAEILPRFRNLDATEISSKSAADDLVTVADRAAEVALAAHAEHIMPGIAVVGEEAVSENPGHLDKIASAERCLIIDPIDGTANFVAGLATFGVIVALVEGGETVFGLLYDPVADDWITARKGQGAFYARDGQAPRRLQVRHSDVDEAIGFLSPRLYPRESRGALFDAYRDFALVRSIGCSCHDYRTLAFGQADFLSSPMMNAWDHAAGVLVLEEAGGTARVAGDGAYAPHLTKGPIVSCANAALLPSILAAQAAEPPSRLDRA